VSRARVPIGCVASNCAISASVQEMEAVRFDPDRLHVAGRIIGAHADLDGGCIMARSALRSPFADSGFSARGTISLTTYSRCNVATRLSPCSAHIRSMMLRKANAATAVPAPLQAQAGKIRTRGVEPWRTQQHWNWKAAVNFLCGGAGAGLFTFAGLGGAQCHALLDSS
jgi:hypothetical protein